MTNQKVINHHKVKHLKNKMKITSLNPYLDKKEEISDSKSSMPKDNLFTIQIIIMESLKVLHGRRQNKKNTKIKNLFNINFVKSILLLGRINKQR